MFNRKSHIVTNSCSRLFSASVSASRLISKPIKNDLVLNTDLKTTLNLMSSTVTKNNLRLFSTARPPIEELMKMTALEQSETLRDDLREKYQAWHKDYNEKHKPNPGINYAITDEDRIKGKQALAEMEEAFKHSVY
jgi:hypothetical protein